MNVYPHEIFMAAEAAAEATVDNLYQRAEEGTTVGSNAAGVTAVTAVVSVLAVGLWVSPLGKRVRRKVAEAIAPKN